MSKVVLPKFNIPGRRARWATNALLCIGGLVVVQVAVFALIAYKRQSAEAAAAPGLIAPVEAAAAAVPAEAPTPVSAAVAAQATDVAAAGVATAAAVPSSSKGAGKAERTSSRRSAHSARRAKATARTSGRSSKVVSSKGSSSKPDALDELLRRFK